MKQYGQRLMIKVSKGAGREKEWEGRGKYIYNMLVYSLSLSLSFSLSRGLFFDRIYGNILNVSYIVWLSWLYYYCISLLVGIFWQCPLMLSWLLMQIFQCEQHTHTSIYSLNHVYMYMWHTCMYVCTCDTYVHLNSYQCFWYDTHRLEEGPDQYTGVKNGDIIITYRMIQDVCTAINWSHIEVYRLLFVLITLSLPLITLLPSNEQSPLKLHLVSKLFAVHLHSCPVV